MPNLRNSQNLIKSHFFAITATATVISMPANEITEIKFKNWNYITEII